MFQLILLTVILGSTPIQVHSQATLQLCPAPLSSEQNEDKNNAPLHDSCEWRDLCGNDPEAGVTISIMECSITQLITNHVSNHENCHLWGSDGSRERMLFVYLLRITSETLTLYYFNDSNSSQMYSSRHQLCAANDNLEIIEMITENCMQDSPEDSVCCSDISINFKEGRMEVHFLRDFIEISVDYLDCTMVTMAATPLASNSTHNNSSTSPSTNPSEEKLTSLVAGISTPLLAMALVALAIVTIMVIVRIKKRKATKNVHDHDTKFEDQDRRYATLTRQEYPDITIDHPTDALYAVVDMNKQGEEREIKQIEENPPIPVEKKGQVALEVLYAVVDKQQKKKQNEETPPALSNPVDGVCYNAAAIRKVHAVEDEEIPPQIPPHTVEELYTAVEKCKKPKGSVNFS